VCKKIPIALYDFVGFSRAAIFCRQSIVSFLVLLPLIFSSPAIADDEWETDGFDDFAIEGEADTDEITGFSLADTVSDSDAPVKLSVTESDMNVDIFGDARPIFQQIADLEQEKVLLQLEKEKVQILLDLDRMAAEQVRLRNDMEKMAGQEEESLLEIERQRFELEKEKLIAQNEKLEDQLKESKENRASGAVNQSSSKTSFEREEREDRGIADRYRLIEIVGAGRQLQATIEDLSSGQKRKVWAGRELDGYEVYSISLDDGVVFYRDGVSESLNISGGGDRD